MLVIGLYRVGALASSMDLSYGRELTRITYYYLLKQRGIRNYKVTPIYNYKVGKL